MKESTKFLVFDQLMASIFCALFSVLVTVMFNSVYTRNFVVPLQMMLIGFVATLVFTFIPLTLYAFGKRQFLNKKAGK